ncbi:FAD-dependent oxidoreductase [Pseudacidovorax sp. NFM-22]|uniref:FAD-dependent oxidoreductase n=1 Tax=Pseudacidovorax sp. NFM-22 TaxID=2744469 RepID=UPI001F1A5BEF|nr:FAD-dependent oxidoreductase [Pseudacidovorax sp. NFM-22]
MTDTTMDFDKAWVLGGGLMGRLMALSLARAGCAVELHEAQGPDAQGAAARVAAAMLAPLAESAVAPLSVVRMGEYALGRWPQLLAGLPAPVFFQQAGTLVVWHRQDAADAGRLGRTLVHNQAQQPSLAAPQSLDATALAEAEPALAGRFMQGLLLPGEGQLDNRQLLAALQQALEAHPQVRLHWHSARNPQDLSPGPRERVIDCRGLGAHAQWPAVRGVRGEVARIHAPEVTLQRPTRLVHPRYPIYIAPKQDHLFVIGATEIESDDMSPPSVRSVLELLSAAYTVHSGFAEARIVEIAAQCRPTLPDNLPALRWLGERVLQINGLYRHGFMIAPAMLDAAMQSLQHRESPLADQLQIGIEHLPAR